MGELFERARAYLAALEAEHQAARALSEQKAGEAKLTKARQEGFQAAMAMLSGEIPVTNRGAHPKGARSTPRASADTPNDFA
jgi:hypothetical protein